MGKLFTCFLLVGSLLCISNYAHAQNVTLFASPASITIDPGETVTVSFFGNDFNGVTGFGGTVHWESSNLTFVEVPLTQGLPGITFNESQVGVGNLIFGWFDPGAGVNLMPTDVIFEVTFTGSTSGTTTVDFASGPAATTVVQGITEYVPVTTPSTVTVTGSPPTNDPNFAYNCTDFTELAFYSAFDTVTTGDQACLEIAVCGFENITGFEYTLDYDQTILQFDSTTNYNLFGLTSSNFGTTNNDQGYISVAWFDDSDNGTTVMDETSIFEVCFTAIGAGGTMDSLFINSSQTVFQAADTTQMQIPVESGPGYVVITGTATSAVTLFATNEVAPAGQNVCVDVKTKNFNDMISMGFTMEWDESIMVFDTIIDPNNYFNGTILSSTNTMAGLVDTGALTVNWIAGGTMPTTLMDSTVFFQVCFDTESGALPGDISPVQFTSSLVPKDATQDDGNGMPIPVPLATTDGSVTIDQNTNPGGFVFNLSDTTGCQGDTITISFLATGFTDIATMSFQINWDIAELQWIGLHDILLPQLFSPNTSPAFTSAGKMTGVWFDFATTGKTFMDDTKLFQMDFEVVGAGSQVAELTFSSGDNNLPVLSVGAPGNVPLPFTENNGTVTCSNSIPPIVITGVVTDVECNGESNGAIDITLADNTDPTTISWVGPSFTAMTEDITDLAAGTYTVTAMDAAGATGTASFTVNEPAVLSATATTVNAICNGGLGGEIDVTVTGGTAGYNFTWDNSLPAQEDQTNLSAGSYCVTVTDINDCAFETCFTVNENSIPTIADGITDATCDNGDGAIDLTISGGVAGYSFSWDNSLPAQEDHTGLDAGTYCVTVTDNASCPVEECFVVGQETASHTVTSVIVDAACSGATDGEIDLTVTGGTTPYVFTWDSNLPSQEDQTGLTNGTYCVTIADANGCEIEDCFDVGAGSASHTVSESVTDASCPGATDGEIDLTVSGGATPYVFTWDSSLPSQEDQTGLTNGTYCVTIADANGCEVDDCFIVGAGSASHTVSASLTDAACGNAPDGAIDLTVSGGATPYVFTWDSSLPSQEDQTGLTAGTYCVTVADANGCEINDCIIVGAGNASHTVSESITDASCGGANGEIDLTVTGGTSPFVFTWDNSLPSQEDQTGLTAGTYCVTIADANDCEINDCFVVGTGNATHTVSESITDASCGTASDGEIDLTVSGGTMPYVFTWDSSLPSQEDQTGLAPGTYCVTIADANGCEIDDCFVVGSGNASHSVSESITDASCGGLADGEIDLTVSGGAMPYVFTWDSSLPSQEDQTGLVTGTYCVTIADANGCEIDDCFIVGETIANHTVSSIITEASCNGVANGAIDLTVSGGVSPYVFTWDSGLPSQEDQTGLIAGTYCVTVTDDANCAMNDCFVVTEQDAPTLTSAITHVTCRGFSNGAIDITISGGAGGYMIDWGAQGSNEDLSNLIAGSYTVTVTDANGCMVNETFIVNEPAADLTASVIGTDVSCNGFNDGSINLTVSGGTSPYDFDWDNGAPDIEDPASLSPGTYTVIVMDANGCVTTTSVAIAEPAALNITPTIVQESLPAANDGSISLLVTGGIASYDFAWNPAMGNTNMISNLAPGTYQVTVTDSNGCEISDSYIIEASTIPQITGFFITDADCAGSASGGVDITIAGGVPNISYLWNDDDGSVTQDLTGVPAGSYSVTITDGDNNVIVGGPYIVNETSSITYSETHVDTRCVGVFDGSITLTINGGSGYYDVFWDGSLEGNPLTGLAPGTYTPIIVDDEGCTRTGVGITINAPDPIDIQVSSVTDNICKNGLDGAISLSIAGGNPTYSVSWGAAGTGATVTGLAAGTYTPTVTDAEGCVEVGPAIEIEEPSLIRGNPIVGSITCNGDEDAFINIAPTGGNGGYTFLWNYNGAVTEDLEDLGPGTYELTITDLLGCSEVIDPIVINQPAPINIAADVNAASPSNDDGSITLNVTGGNGNYDYNWSGVGGPFGNTSDLFGLPSGEYFVTVTDDKGCEQMGQYIVSGSLGISGVVTDVSCFGEDDGSVTLIINGGVMPVAFEWSPGFANGQNLNDVAAGIYSVTVEDANGILSTATYEINEPTQIVITNIEATNESGAGCNGSIDIQVEGGSPPYTYNWSNGMNNQNPEDLCKGDYSVEIIDANGCVVSSEEITIGPAEVTVTNFNITSLGCPGDDNAEACFDIFGGCAPYSIMLDANPAVIDLDGSICIDDLSAGLHTITILDNLSQSTTYQFTITQAAGITATTQIINNTDLVNCNGSINLTVTGGSPSYTYQWSHGPISEDVGDLCDNLSPYSVTITDSNGCTEVVTGLEVEFGITIVADVMDVCDVVNCDGAIDLEVVGGTEVYTYNWSTGAFSEDIFEVCGGVYDVTVTDSDGNSAEQTFVVQSPTAALDISEENVQSPTGPNNGLIDVSISGGYGGYSYIWSNGLQTQDIAGLGAGTYVLTVTDQNGCVDVQSFILAPPGEPVTFIVDDPLCNGSGDGCLEAIPGIGTPPYSFAWSTGGNTQKICGLVSGAYTVTITDADGLELIDSQILSNPSPLLVSISEEDASSLLANVTGGTGEYTYNWNTPGADMDEQVFNLSPGTYSVLVTDGNDCTTTAAYDLFPAGDCEDTRNVITPNNDGDNETFVIVCAYSIVDSELEIYNRWGKLVHESVSYDNSWNGTDLDGAPLPEGGYFYVFRFTEPGSAVRVESKGHITILR